MKTAVIICALAMVSCISTANAYNEGTAALTRLRSTAQLTSSQLDRYGRNLMYTTKSKLSTLKQTEMVNVNSITNPALNTLQAEISAAKANGKNADHCYEPARQRIRLTSLAAWKNLDKCADDALVPVNAVKSNVDAFVLLGGRLVKELDAIAIGCISSNPMVTQNCIIAKIPEASATVRNYESTGNLLKTTGDSTSTNAQNSARTCYQGAVQIVRQETDAARADGHRCVLNA